MDSVLLNLCFDLDDTLYAEADYVRLGHAAVAREAANISHIDVDVLLDVMTCGANPFDALHSYLHDSGFEMSVARMVEIYRFETRGIRPYPDAVRFLELMKRESVPMTLITDGRSISQRNKYEDLGLERYIPSERLIISQELGAGKETSLPFVKAESLVKARNRIYVADNPAKDFLMPGLMGWTTVAVRSRGGNIHPQRFDDVAPNCRPHYVIDSFDSLPVILQQLAL